MRIRYTSLLLMLWLLNSSIQAEARVVRIITAEYPPFALQNGLKPDGFCVAVVREMQKRVGSTSPIEIFPWARAYMMAVTEPDVMLVCPERTPWRESNFKWVGPIYVSRTHLYAKRSGIPKITTLDAVAKLSGVLVPRNSHAMEFLNGIGFKNVEPVDSAQLMLRMLMADRRPAMLLEERQLDALLNDEGISPGLVVPIYTVFIASKYLGFSSKTSNDVVLKWDKALAAMKSDGTFLRIYRKWFRELPQLELLH